MACIPNNAIIQIVLNDIPPRLQSKIVVLSLNVRRVFEESCTGGFFRTAVLGWCHELTILAVGALRHGGVLSGGRGTGRLSAVSITPTTTTAFRC